METVEATREIYHKRSRSLIDSNLFSLLLPQGTKVSEREERVDVVEWGGGTIVIGQLD